jgi:hypothetical protein
MCDVRCAEEYRSAGVIFGMMSAKVKKPARVQELTRMMRFAWTEFVRRKPEDKEIRHLIDNSINPYTGSKFEGTVDKTFAATRSPRVQAKRT